MAVPEFHVVGDALVDVIASGLARIPSWDGDADAASIDVKVGRVNSNHPKLKPRDNTPRNYPKLQTRDPKS